MTTSFVFKNFSLELYSIGDCLDGPSQDGYCRNTIWKIFDNFKIEGNVTVKNTDKEFQISNTSELLMVLSDLGYDYYLNNIHLLILNSQIQKFRI